MAWLIPNTTGLTGAPVHSGSWLGGLPDFGVTEFLQGTKSTSPTDSGATRDWTLPPVDSTTTPSAPRPQNSISNVVPTSSGSSGNFMDYYAGWNPDAARADFNATYGGDIGRLAAAKGGGLGATDPRLAEAENFFNQSNTLLGQQEDLLRATQATANQGVENYAQSALEQALNQRTSAQKLAASQRNETSLNQRQQEAEAIRAYNNLQQQSSSRYGMGSSTGGALSEILGQTFLQTQGSLREKTQAMFQKIFDYDVQTEKDYNSSTNNIEKQKQLAIRQNEDKMREGLLQIATLRNENGLARTNLRIQILADNLQRARQIEDYSRQLKDSYDMWYAQQKVSAQEGWNYANQLYQNAINENLFGQQQIQQQNQPLLGLGTTPGANYHGQSQYRPWNKTEDELSKQTNPWLA